MSPVSRGRKKKRPTTRPRSARRVLPGLDGVHAELLGAFRPAVRATDPLEVEVLASDVLGSWWKRLPPGEDPDAVFGEGAIGHAARAGTREAMALLRALAVLGVTPAQREAASSAAAALAAAGVADPPWAATIGRVEVGDCWRLSDVFGDQASVLSVFGYGSREHGLVALVDFNHLGGWVKDLFVTPEPARVLRELRKTALSEPFAVLDQVELAEARQLLEDGLAATDATWEPEVSDELRQFRALALARCRAMPKPNRPAQPVPEIDNAERDAIVAEFFASPHAAGLPEEAARYGARLVVDFGADYDAGRPLRVSPAKIVGFLLDWVPAKVSLDDADRDALPHVVTAWVRWAGERTGLDSAAVAQLVDVARDCGEDFGEAYEEGADASPIRQYLHGLDTGGDLADAQDGLDRRMFAMPYFGTRIGDEDYPSLDPGDPDERRLLIEGEHPEYHAVLEDPGFDGEIDGVNPRLHIAIHEAVANQLWEDDPAEAWRAAKRLHEAGVDRHDILHQLGSVVAAHLHGALTNRQAVDLVAYRQALDAVRPPSSRRRATSAVAPVRDAVYQVKVTLRGAKPPIWRRLRLPAATTLAQLHQVIQVAFGWEDAHLHAFEVGGRRYSRPDFELWDEAADEDKARLRDLAARPGTRLRYTYDFGDSWEHDVRVEDILPSDGLPHAVCLTGRRAGPPEDCGGVWGYAELCDILADPDHPDHAERVDWLGHPYDPAAFDKDAVNASLARIRLG
jgi:Plasmid pRiA4b ORF-3-like protein/Domain of unknown function (DUF1841)